MLEHLKRFGLGFLVLAAFMATFMALVAALAAILVNSTARVALLGVLLSGLVVFACWYIGTELRGRWDG